VSRWGTGAEGPIAAGWAGVRPADNGLANPFASRVRWGPRKTPSSRKVRIVHTLRAFLLSAP